MVEQQEDETRAARDRASSGMLRKELDMRLTAYLPAVVRRHLERQDMHHPLPMPTTHRTTVVSMFADVSGFTAMTESLAARGPVGAEDLGKHLNSYFEQLLRLVSSAGGDVFKFAGDAMLIFWPESKEDTLDSLLRRALQCALRIQSHLHEAELARGVVLSVKVGVGIGEATIAHLGGESDGATTRIEYVAVGPALEQAFSAEHQAEAGDVICSSECWKRQYVSRAVWPYLDAHDEFWGSELRDVTVLFINLGFSEQDLAQMLGAKELQRLQDAFSSVQKCVYDYEGTINKFLVDDKGSTVIAAFGLPPVTHENDPIRGILASLAICASLGNTDLKASVGITTGTALCGVVGHQGNRREYTVLGDIVNLSARLMQRAKSEGGGVITDAATKIYTQDVLHFEMRPEIMVKGKNESIKIHRPYPRMSILLDYHLSSSTQQSSRKPKPNSVRPVEGIIGRAGRANALSVVSRAAPIQNLMENMHRVQVRDAQRRLSLRAERQCLPAEELVESESFIELRAALLDKCSRLNRFAPGGAFILEGDIGVGKTVLLRSALASPEAGDYQVLVGTANPFVTKKPYAVWSELITREPAPPLSPEVGSAAVSNPVVQAPNRVAETERRACVARFVRQKIREGAAPNTTLVRYAHLLNAILDTDFDGYPDRESNSSTTRLKNDGENNCAPASDPEDERSATNQNEEDTETEDQRQNEEEIRACGYAFAESTGRTLNVKEEEIASWFLGDEQEGEWRPADLDISGILLLCALHAMSRERATVFCLDSAMYMDEKSWILVTIIAKYFTNCLVVVGTRPPSLALGENTESSSFRKQLRMLKRMKASTSKSIDTLTSHEIEELSRQILKVPVIPKNLLAILGSRSQGNPLFLHEIIAEMQEQQVIQIDEKKRTFASSKKEKKSNDKDKDMNPSGKGKLEEVRKTKHRCKCCGYVFCAECTPNACQAKIPGKSNESSGNNGGHSSSSPASVMFPPVSGSETLTNRIALRPPRTVKSVLTTMLDQLTVSQRMLMKTASAIGPSFDREMLRATCPIEAHLSRFAQDLEDMEQLAMIRRINTFIGGVPASSKPSLTASGAILTTSQTAPPSSHVKVKFEFNHGFMRGVIREQMLRGQLDKLNARIADFREQQQKELRHKFFKATESLSRPLQLTIPPSLAEGGEIVQGVRRALTPTRAATASDSSSESSTTQALQDESEYDDGLSSVSGRVLVKKHCSVFSHLKLKGLKNARQWKTRYAVLQNARLLLQYEENDPIGNANGAKVSACDPEVATKVNCFQVEVSKWTKGRYLMEQRRSFVIGVESEEEVESWVYLIRYAIESLEANP
uniref:Adenylate cyclase n=1 Tax=Phytophthora ramorum TaxID=164328 RepID=H3HE67_PHYRM